jgi:hypothetical protein
VFLLNVLVIFSSLKRMFPFEGEFHFRLKSFAAGHVYGAEGFVWTVSFVHFCASWMKDVTVCGYDMMDGLV